MPEPFPRPGEWPCYRGNGRLDARSAGLGRITNPRVAWKQFVGARETRLIVEPRQASETLSLPTQDVRDDAAEGADPRWGLSVPLGDIEGRSQPIYRSGTVTYAHVLPEAQGLQKLEFESGFSKPTVNGQWQECVGRCRVWKDGQWVTVWETEAFSLMFIPMPLVGDFDADGQLEVAFLPWYELVILDARTGKVKDRCRFTKGRSYGFFGVYDLDGDGKSEFVVQSDFAKHVDVLGYREGKLSLLWQREIEMDFANPQKILRVGPDPVADVDGDGRPEVLINLYNGDGDGRWHITVHDGMTGAAKVDLPDEHLEGLLDVDGDGTSELLTTRTTGGGVPAYGTIAVRRLKEGQAVTVWQMDEVGWQTWEPPQPPHVNSGSTLANRTVLSRRFEKHATVVLRQRVKDRPDEVSLLLAMWAGDGFHPGTRVSGPRLDALAMDADRSLLVRCSTKPETPSELIVTSGRARVLSSQPRGVTPGTAVVAQDGDRPVVIVQGADEEMVAFQPPRGDGAPVERWRLPGRGQSTNWPGEARGPVLADLSGDGRRQLLYATAAPDGCGRIVAADLNGHTVWHHDFPNIPGTPPIWNTGSIVIWQVGHFTDPQRQDVLVTVRRSIMHSEQVALLSGRDGSELWSRAHEIDDRGVGGTPFAIADYDGDGLDDIASLYPSELYLLKGTTGRDLLNMQASWEGVPARPVYWGIPIAGDFEGSGRVSLFFGSSNGSMTGLVRPDGKLLWWDALDKSPRSLPAFGDFDGDGHPEAIGVGYQEDGIRCYDTATGKIKWRLPMPASGDAAGTAGADINSDGRDEALFVLGSTLYCAGIPKPGEAGALLWKLDFPTSLGPPTIADADGDGLVEVILVGADGFVYGVR